MTIYLLQIYMVARKKVEHTCFM